MLKWDIGFGILIAVFMVAVPRLKADHRWAMGVKPVNNGLVSFQQAKTEKEKIREFHLQNIGFQLDALEKHGKYPHVHDSGHDLAKGKTMEVGLHTSLFLMGLAQCNEFYGPKGSIEKGVFARFERCVKENAGTLINSYSKGIYPKDDPKGCK